jgi:hypothetical protein
MQFAVGQQSAVVVRSAFSGVLMPSRLPSLALAACLVVVGGCNCGAKPKVTRVLEDFKVVPGNPSVTPDAPGVSINTQLPPVKYGVNVPRQCDLFVQNTVRKVDILWVIQNSGSMASHQAQLAQNFTSFISFLLSADPPIDFHIGVVSTDTDNPQESGKLHGFNSTPAGAFIGCTPTSFGDGGFQTVCNTQPAGGDPSSSVETAFTQMSAVGTQGSSHQRGLYASYLALSRPENLDNGSGAGFVRNDAALYVVYVGSEDDLSCSPTLGSPPPAGKVCRTVDFECSCADDAQLAYGTTTFYERFLKSYKGYGHEDLVAAAAVVAVDQLAVPSEFGDSNPHVGCSAQDPATGRTLIAYYGKRYVEVAQATGGAATSICSSNFNDALTRLGFAVSGLRRDFKLSRGPDTQSIQVYVSKRDSPTCTADTECAGSGDYSSCQAGRCAKAVGESLQPSDNGAQYVRCQNGVVRNIVDFGSNVVPPAQGTVEVCYNVDAHFSTLCQ